MFSDKRHWLFYLFWFICAGSTALAEGLEKRIFLRYNQTNVVLEGQVSEGEANKYVFEADVNQEVVIHLVSGSGNAFFSLQGPESGNFDGVKEEALAHQWEDILPLRGDYTLTVHSQRGKTFYALDIIFGKSHPLDKARNACLTAKKDLTTQERVHCYEESAKQWEKVINEIYADLLETEGEQVSELLKEAQTQYARFEEEALKIFELFFKTTSEEIQDTVAWMVARIKMEMVRERVSVLEHTRRTKEVQEQDEAVLIPRIHYDEELHSLDRVLQKCLEPDSGVLPTECYEETTKKWNEELNLANKTLMEKLKGDTQSQLKEMQGQWLAFEEKEFELISAVSEALEKAKDYPFEKAEKMNLIRAGTLLLDRYQHVFSTAIGSNEAPADALEEDTKIRTITPAEQAELRVIINSAQNGDVIRFKAGIYQYKNAVNIANKENLTLEGEGEVWIIVENIKDDVIKIQDSKRIFLKNIKARHQSPLAAFNCEGAVVKIENTSQVWITACELNGSGADGVHVDRGEDIIVNRCYIHHNTLAAFMLEEAKTVAIHNNTISENGSTLYTLSSDSIRMNANIVGENKGEQGWSTSFTQEILQELPKE